MAISQAFSVGLSRNYIFQNHKNLKGTLRDTNPFSQRNQMHKTLWVRFLQKSWTATVLNIIDGDILKRRL